MDETPLPWDSITPEVEVFRAPIADVTSPAIAPPPLVAPQPSGGAFTIPLICIGIGLIAMCLLIPAADENRRLTYETARLKGDLEQLQKQVVTNDSFLHRVAGDATLAERLARRQMKMVPEGTAVLDLHATQTRGELSPFLLVTVPPPAAMPPYRPVAGFLADACRHPKTQLYLIGASLLMIASGLVMSRSGPPVVEGAQEIADNLDTPIKTA